MSEEIRICAKCDHIDHEGEWCWHREASFAEAVSGNGFAIRRCKCGIPEDVRQTAAQGCG